MDQEPLVPWVPPIRNPATSRYILMEGRYGQIMVEDADGETQARDMCSIWFCRETNQQHSNELWMSWHEVARFRPAEGRRVARKLKVMRLYVQRDPFEYVLKVRRPWPRRPST